MAYHYENLKLEKGMYGQSGRSFAQTLEALLLGDGAMQQVSSLGAVHAYIFCRNHRGFQGNLPHMFNPGNLLRTGKQDRQYGGSAKGSRKLHGAHSIHIRRGSQHNGGKASAWKCGGAQKE